MLSKFSCPSSARSLRRTDLTGFSLEVPAKRPVPLLNPCVESNQSLGIISHRLTHKSATSLCETTLKTIAAGQIQTFLAMLAVVMTVLHSADSWLRSNGKFSIGSEHAKTSQESVRGFR